MEPVKEIIYSPDDHDYSAYLDGEYIGSFTYHIAAEVALNRLAIELIQFAAGWNAAASLCEVAV